MFAYILVFVAAVAVVATYLLIINRFLRSDDHWNEDGQPVAPANRQRTASTSTQTRGTASFTPNHA